MKKINCNVDDCDTCENGKVNSCKTCKDGYLLFLGNYFPCEFPCSRCALTIADVIGNQVIPFIQPFQAANSPTPTGTLPTDIDMFTIDLNNIPTEYMELITLGYFFYQTIDDYVAIGA